MANKPSGKKQKLTWDEAGRVLTCAYPSIGKKLVVDTAKFSAGIQEDARQHGYHQKFGDAASGGTPAEKFAEASLILESLLTGEWSRTAGPVDRTPEILAAVCALKACTVKEIDKKAYLVNAAGAKAEITEDLVAAWGKAEDVRVEIQAQRLAKAEKALAESKSVLEVEFK